MKLIVKALLSTLMAAAPIASAGSLEVFNMEFALGDDCQVLYEKAGESGTLDPGFKQTDASCRIVTHNDTNVPKLVYVNGMYLFLIESNQETEDDCTSEYRAVGVSRDGAPKLSISRRSGTCFTDPDVGEYEYLSNTM